MNPTRAFGVGCFHFGYHKTIPYRFAVSNYVEDVKKALSSLPSLSELNVSFFEELSDTFDVLEEMPSLENGDYFPPVMGLEITFKLFIPYRIQSELFPNEPIGIQTTTESFQVTLRDSFYGPSCFVECIGATEDCSPSNSVRLLREYLAREFKKLTTPVSFEFLGPSPFHANFFLQPSANAERDLTLEETKRRGYNDLIFKFNPKFPADDVLENLCDELSDELGLFYEIQRRAVRLMKDGDKLTTDWQALRSIMNPSPSLFDLRTRFRIHRDAQALVSDAYTLQAQYAVEEQQTQSDIASTYDRGTTTYLKAYVCDRSEKLPTYPVESIIKWAEHIVGSSLKQAEIAAVVLSAVGGGIIGSLLTLLTSRS